MSGCLPAALGAIGFLLLFPGLCFMSAGPLRGDFQTGPTILATGGVMIGVAIIVYNLTRNR